MLPGQGSRAEYTACRAETRGFFVGSALAVGTAPGERAGAAGLRVLGWIEVCSGLSRRTCRARGAGRTARPRRRLPPARSRQAARVEPRQQASPAKAAGGRWASANCLWWGGSVLEYRNTCVPSVQVGSAPCLEGSPSWVCSSSLTGSGWRRHSNNGLSLWTLTRHGSLDSDPVTA